MSEEKNNLKENQNSETPTDAGLDLKVDMENSESNSENIVVNDNQETDELKTKTTVVKGKKKKKAAPFLRGGRGQAHINSTYNNTLISITDLNGSVLLWSTAGKSGFKGPKKSTPYAAGVIVKNLSDKVKALGIKELDVYVKGVGTGREAAVRAFDTNGIKIIAITDVTPVAHGGCRPRKRRRV